MSSQSELMSASFLPIYSILFYKALFNFAIILAFLGHYSHSSGCWGTEGEETDLLSVGTGWGSCDMHFNCFCNFYIEIDCSRICLLSFRFYWEQLYASFWIASVKSLSLSIYSSLSLISKFACSYLTLMSSYILRDSSSWASSCLQYLDIF